MSDSNWIEGREAINLLANKLGEQISPDQPTGITEKLKLAGNLKQRAVLAVQRAIFSGELEASHVSGTETEHIPKIAFAVDEGPGKCLALGFLEIDPLWPDEWQHWSGKLWSLPRKAFVKWLESDSPLKPCSPGQLPAFLANEMPASIKTQPLPETTLVTLSEAISFFAFGIALSADRLARAMRRKKLCDGSEDEAKDRLMEALHRISDLGSQNHIAFFGRYVGGEDDQDDPQSPIAASKLAEYGKYQVGNDILCRGSGVYWRFNASDDEPSEMEPSGDHFTEVRLSRSGLLKCLDGGKVEIPPELISMAPKVSKAGGSKPHAFWEAAINHVWERMYNNDFKPKKQAEIEDAIKAFVVDQGHEEPSPSATRTRAKLIWNSFEQD